MDPLNTPQGTNTKGNKTTLNLAETELVLEALFLVILGTSLFPGEHEVHGKSYWKPCWERNELEPSMPKNMIYDEFDRGPWTTRVGS